MPLHGLVAGGSAAEPLRLSEEDLWQRLASARVVCFGETHDDPHHHYAELRALREVAARARADAHTFAVGFEMFQRPFQTPLSEFVAGTLSEPDFLTQSEYAKRWGFDFALYRPLLEAARELELAALALNTPKELTRQVAREGLASLPESQREELPDLVLDDERHRAYFDQAMGNHPMPPGAPTLDDMYAAQVLWDETMAETAAQWLAQVDPSSALMLFAGSGHCHHRAIPARLTRRSSTPVLSVKATLASLLDEEKDALALYDLLVVLEDDAPGGGAGEDEALQAN